MTRSEDPSSPRHLLAIVERLQEEMTSVKAQMKAPPGRARRFAIRLYDLEFEKLEAAANARGSSMSDYVRERLDLPRKSEAPETDGAKPPARRGPRAAGARAKKRR